MEKRSVFDAQLEGLNNSLRKAKKTLEYPKINPALSKRVRIPLSRQIQERMKELEQLQGDAKEGLPLDACWDALRLIRQRCDGVFRECLAFAQGSLMRGVGLDDGICEIADALLGYLSYRSDSKWDRFTMLAEGEFFTGMAQIIRLRFADLTVWSLPLAAHEFGHYLGPRLTVERPDGSARYPFIEMLELAKQKGEKSEAYLHEHFSDLFATYALGPAFACTCILLRFDPRTAYEDKARHPGDAARVYLILKTLEQMGNRQTAGIALQPYDWIINKLGTVWKENLIAAGRPDSLDEAAANPLDDLLDRLYTMLESTVPDVQYDGWLRAQNLVAQLSPDGDRDSPIMFNEKDTLADALNAAWYSRLQHWDAGSFAVRRIEERAVALCVKMSAAVD